MNINALNSSLYLYGTVQVCETFRMHSVTILNMSAKQNKRADNIRSGRNVQTQDRPSLHVPQSPALYSTVSIDYVACYKSMSGLFLLEVANESSFLKSLNGPDKRHNEEINNLAIVALVYPNRSPLQGFTPKHKLQFSLCGLQYFLYCISG